MQHHYRTPTFQGTSHLSVARRLHTDLPLLELFSFSLHTLCFHALSASLEDKFYRVRHLSRCTLSLSILFAYISLASHYLPVTLCFTSLNISHFVRLHTTFLCTYLGPFPHTLVDTHTASFTSHSNCHSVLSSQHFYHRTLQPPYSLSLHTSPLAVGRTCSSTWGVSPRVPTFSFAFDCYLYLSVTSHHQSWGLSL